MTKVAMDYLTEVVNTIKPVLKQYGFKKERLNWIFENDDIVKVLNLQKSSYAKQIYINIGIVIKAISPTVKYVHYESQIQSRLDHLIDGKFLEFENPQNETERLEAFKDLLIGNPYNFFMLKGTKQELLKFVKESNTHMLFLTAKKYLGIE
jgi:DNA-directed RNA polymerase subunit H (RpoH/RPB5)